MIEITELISNRFGISNLIQGWEISTKGNTYPYFKDRMVKYVPEYNLTISNNLC